MAYSRLTTLVQHLVHPGARARAGLHSGRDAHHAPGTRPSRTWTCRPTAAGWSSIPTGAATPTCTSCPRPVARRARSPPIRPATSAPTGRRTAAGSSSTRSGPAIATSTPWTPTAPASPGGPPAQDEELDPDWAPDGETILFEMFGRLRKPGFGILRLADGAPHRAHRQSSPGDYAPLVAGRQGILYHGADGLRLRRVDWRGRYPARLQRRRRCRGVLRRLVAGWGEALLPGTLAAGAGRSGRCPPRAAPVPCW